MQKCSIKQDFFSFNLGVRPLGIKSNLYSCEVADYAEFLLLTSLVKVLGCVGSKLLLFTNLYRYSVVNRQTSIEKFSNTSWHKIHCTFDLLLFIYCGGRRGQGK